MKVNMEEQPIRSEGKPALEPVITKGQPAGKPAYGVNLGITKRYQRTAFYRNYRTMQKAGLQGTGENASIIDLFLGSQDKGLPIATIQHSISTQSIIELSLGLGSALILSGLVLKK